MDASAGFTSKAMDRTGWVVGGLPAALLIASSAMKLMRLEGAIETLTALGYPQSVIVGIGVAELACAILYLIPRTAVLGAVLSTGFLGGATASHVRVGEYLPMFIPVATAAALWLGLVLRDARLRAVLPVRR